MNNDLMLKYITPILPIETFLAKRGEPTHAIKAVLFDIYGTLFISAAGDISYARKADIKNKALVTLLEKFSFQMSPAALQDKLFKAIEIKHAELRGKGIDRPEVEIDHIWMDVLAIENNEQARAFAMEYELIMNPVYPMPNLEAMLTACREKVVMGIISNAQFYTPLLFEWFLGRKPEQLGFQKGLTLFSYLTGIAKPSLNLFRLAAEALKRMGIPAHSVVYIGNDMLNDIYPAKQTGFQTALFAGDARSLRMREDEPECKHLSPDMVITDLIQLVDYF